MRWTFLVPTVARPTGGDVAVFEVANALVRAGRDQVQVVHLPLFGDRVQHLDQIPWVEFDPRVVHHFREDLHPGNLPDGDIAVYSTKLLAAASAPDAGEGGRRLIESLRGLDDHRWLPVLFLQGHGVFDADLDDLVWGLPGPKVCVGSWLAELLVAHGVPEHDVVHIPNGVDPTTFRVMRPIADRRPAAAMAFDPHPVKGGEAGLDALERLHAQMGVPATVFGARPLARSLPSSIRFELQPTRRSLAEDIYNGSSMFLQPSRQEGFGMCAVEAMASGCALVTTDNGGSTEYAIDGETALVCDHSVDAMVESLARLAADDRLRIRVAEAGARYVERFRWPVTAARLADLASERLGNRAHPDEG